MQKILNLFFLIFPTIIQATVDVKFKGCQKDGFICDQERKELEYFCPSDEEDVSFRVWDIWNSSKATSFFIMNCMTLRISFECQNKYYNNSIKKVAISHVDNLVFEEAVVVKNPEIIRFENIGFIKFIPEHTFRLSKNINPESQLSEIYFRNISIGVIDTNAISVNFPHFKKFTWKYVSVNVLKAGAIRLKFKHQMKCFLVENCTFETLEHLSFQLNVYDATFIYNTFADIKSLGINGTFKTFNFLRNTVKNVTSQALSIWAHKIVISNNTFFYMHSGALENIRPEQSGLNDSPCIYNFSDNIFIELESGGLNPSPDLYSNKNATIIFKKNKFSCVCKKIQWFLWSIMKLKIGDTLRNFYTNIINSTLSNTCYEPSDILLFYGLTQCGCNLSSSVFLSCGYSTSTVSSIFKTKRRFITSTSICTDSILNLTQTSIYFTNTLSTDKSTYINKTGSTINCNKNDLSCLTKKTSLSTDTGVQVDNCSCLIKGTNALKCDTTTNCIKIGYHNIFSKELDFPSYPASCVENDPTCFFKKSTLISDTNVCFDTLSISTKSLDPSKLDATSVCIDKETLSSNTRKYFDTSSISTKSTGTLKLDATSVYIDKNYYTMLTEEIYLPTNTLSKESDFSIYTASCLKDDTTCFFKKTTLISDTSVYLDTSATPTKSTDTLKLYGTSVCIDKDHDTMFTEEIYLPTNTGCVENTSVCLLTSLFTTENTHVLNSETTNVSLETRTRVENYLSEFTERIDLTLCPCCVNNNCFLSMNKTYLTTGISTSVDTSSTSRFSLEHVTGGLPTDVNVCNDNDYSTFIEKLDLLINSSSCADDDYIYSLWVDNDSLGISNKTVLMPETSGCIDIFSTSKSDSIAGTNVCQDYDSLYMTNRASLLTKSSYYDTKYLSTHTSISIDTGYLFFTEEPDLLPYSNSCFDNNNDYSFLTRKSGVINDTDALTRRTDSFMCSHITGQRSLITGTFKTYSTNSNACIDNDVSITSKKTNFTTDNSVCIDILSTNGDYTKDIFKTIEACIDNDYFLYTTETDEDHSDLNFATKMV